jgi:hypothetical protein
VASQDAAYSFAPVPVFAYLCIWGGRAAAGERVSALATAIVADQGMILPANDPDDLAPTRGCFAMSALVFYFLAMTVGS